MGMGMGMGMLRVGGSVALLALLAFASLSLTGPRCSWAQAGSDSETLNQVREWLARELAVGFSLDHIAPVHLFLAVGRQVPDSSQAWARYRTLAREVAGKPEHPNRPEFELMHRTLLSDTNTNLMELFVGGARTLRQNDTFGLVPDEARFFDSVFSEKLLWSMNPVQVNLVDPARGHPDHVHLGSLPTSVWHACGFMASGGLHLWSHHGAHITALSKAGPLYRAELASGDGAMRGVVEFDWDSISGLGRVHAQSMVDSSTSNGAGSWVIEDWTWNEDLGRWVAMKWTSRKPGTLIDIQWRVKHVERITAAQVQAAVTPPAFGRPDPIRGEVALLVDYRNDPRGRVSSLVAGVDVPEGTRAPSTYTGRARLFVAAAAGCIVLLLVILRFRWRMN